MWLYSYRLVTVSLSYSLNFVVRCGNYAFYRKFRHFFGLKWSATPIPEQRAVPFLVFLKITVFWDVTSYVWWIGPYVAYERTCEFKISRIFLPLRLARGKKLENFQICCLFTKKTYTRNKSNHKSWCHVLNCAVYGDCIRAWCAVYYASTSSWSVSVLVNPLKTKRKLFYLKTQFVPRSKHFSTRLKNQISLCYIGQKSLFVLR
jgi:hypothetical protein